MWSGYKPDARARNSADGRFSRPQEARIADVRGGGRYLSFVDY